LAGALERIQYHTHIVDFQDTAITVQTSNKKFQKEICHLYGNDTQNFIDSYSTESHKSIIVTLSKALYLS